MNYEFNLLRHDYTVCPDTWGMIDECAIFYRMYYIYGGEAYIKEESKHTRLEKGCFYIFPQMDPYTLWQNIQNPLEVLWFHVELKQVFYGEVVVVKIEENSVLCSLLKSIYYLTNKPELFEETKRLFDIFLTLLNQEIPTYNPTSKQMKKVMDYIDLNVGKNLTVAHLAQFIGMERSYFCRKFKSNFNISPSRYILAKKMSEGAKALVNGATVLDASLIAGYLDEKAFSRAFKSYMEISPSQYKKSHIQQT